MTTVPLRLPEELKAIATAQAARTWISLNQCIATVLAAHVGAQADTLSLTSVSRVSYQCMH